MCTFFYTTWISPITGQYSLAWISDENRWETQVSWLRWCFFWWQAKPMLTGHQLSVDAWREIWWPGYQYLFAGSNAYMRSLSHCFISGLNIPCLMPEAKGEDNFYYWMCLENWGLKMFNSQQLTSFKIAHFKKIPGSLVEGSLPGKKYTEELICKIYMRTHCLNSNGSILNLENWSLLKEEWHEDLPTHQAGITMVCHHLSMNYLTNYKQLSYLFGN